MQAITQRAARPGSGRLSSRLAGQGGPGSSRRGPVHPQARRAALHGVDEAARPKFHAGQCTTRADQRRGRLGEAARKVYLDARAPWIKGPADEGQAMEAEPRYPCKGGQLRWNTSSAGVKGEPGRTAAAVHFSSSKPTINDRHQPCSSNGPAQADGGRMGTTKGQARWAGRATIDTRGQAGSGAYLWIKRQAESDGAPRAVHRLGQ